MIAKPCAVLALCAAASAPVAAEIAFGPDQTLPAPSGFDVTPYAVHYEEDTYSGERLVVVRLIAPAVASPVLSANLQADMEWACETWGLPASDALARPAERIIVEMMQAPVPRGEPSPDIVQFFETYTPVDGVCIWRLF